MHVLGIYYLLSVINNSLLNGVSHTENVLNIIPAFMSELSTTHS